MIDVHDLHFTYARSHKAAVRGLTFAVERGEIFGFLGPSGAGKSTTQKILIGLLEGYRGFVRVRDKKVANWPADDYEVPLGQARIVQEGSDVSIITYGLMVHEAMRAATEVAARFPVAARSRASPCQSL